MTGDANEDAGADQRAQRWALALQSAQFGVWDLDIPGQQVDYSPEWQVMLGYPAAGGPEPTTVWRERVHPDDLPGMLDAQRRYLGGQGDVYETEFRVRAADGQYRWVLSRGRVVERDAQQRPLRAVGTLTDLTDRKNAEAWRLAHQKAEAGSQAKSAFLSRMSHELRTPLNAVLGFAQVMRESGTGLEPDRQQLYLRHIETAGWHLLTLVNDVLDLARIERGELQVKLAPVPLAEVMTGAAGILSMQAADAGVPLHVQAPPASAQVMADPCRLHQVLLQLLENAIRHNRPGGEVWLEAEALAGAPRRWLILVRDTGPGIPVTQLTHLFQPFNLEGRAPGAPDSTGVGLALSHWLVGAMGGQLHVDSTEGQGTTLRVILEEAAG